MSVLSDASIRTYPQGNCAVTRIYEKAAKLDRVGMGLLRLGLRERCLRFVIVSLGHPQGGACRIHLLHGDVLLFEQWLDEHFPDRKAKILGRIRDIRGGTKLNDTRWGSRIKGEGIFSEQIASMFEISCRRAGFGGRRQLSTASFRRSREQLDLFNS